jgi:eukaryotic-like serine/threonine-protein kinase
LARNSSFGIIATNFRDMQSSQAGLTSLAEAVADGAEIDWDHAESSVEDPGERGVIRQLRQLAGLGQAARSRAARWGQLEIRTEVGHGTFGTVYRAWDPRLDREVALKLLPTTHPEQELASAVITEGKLLARIRHPNVVTVYGADTYDGRVGIWMEFVTGRTLKAILDEQGPFSAHEAAMIGRDVCRALTAVHRQGFVHRDIKAQNVMREAGGRTVLMDFGAGAAVQPDSTTVPALSGSPAYLAPEVLAGGAPTAKSDLYSLGVLLFYLVSGEFPVVGGSLQELRERHTRGPRRLLRDVRPNLPSAFVRVVDAALAPTAEGRPQTAGAMEELLEGTILEAAPSRPSQRLGGLRDWRVVTAAVAVAAIASIGWAEWDRLPWRTQPVVTRNSVAILPFRNLTSAGNDNDYFSEGITEDLVAHLSALRDLRVISGVSMRRYQALGKTEREIGTELGVAAVLNGSVRQSADRVRIVSELVDAATGEQLWSESFERELEDVFTMQNEVARKIAVALKGELSLPDVESLSASRNHDVEAFTLYMRGRYQWGLRTQDGMHRAIQLFQDAVARDPQYALAYAGMSDAYTTLGTYGFVSRHEAYAKAAEAAERAIQLDANLAEAHASLGYVRKNRFEWSLADASFRRATVLKPQYATGHQFYAIFLTQTGRLREALAESKTAVALDPLSISANMGLAGVLLMARRYDDAIEQYQKVLRFDAGFTSAYKGLATVYMHRGDYAQAAAAHRRAAETAPAAAEDQELKSDVGYVAAKSGRRADALRIIEDLTHRYDKAGEEVAGSIAAIYCGLGERDNALAWLGRAYQTRDPELGYLRVDPRWDVLRDDPRFVSLLQTLGLNH